MDKIGMTRIDQQKSVYIDLLIRSAEDSGGGPMYLDRLEAILFPAGLAPPEPSGLGWPTLITSSPNPSDLIDQGDAKT